MKQNKPKKINILSEKLNEHRGFISVEVKEAHLVEKHFYIFGYAVFFFNGASPVNR